MAGTAGAKRKARENKSQSRPAKKFKKQKAYFSDSESDGERIERLNPTIQEEGLEKKVKVSKKRDQRQIPPPAASQDAQSEDSQSNEDVVDEDEDEDDEAATTDAASESEAASDMTASDSEAELSETSQPQRKRTKRRDPDAFANSMAAILSSKLTTVNRKDPVLARSKDAATTAHELSELRLETKAKRKMRDEKRALNEKGRVRNVLLGDRKRTPGLSESEAEEGMLSEATESAKPKGQSAADIAEQERRLKKTAQRGVVKLFNAVRAAQVKAEEAGRDAKTTSIIGVKRREEKVGEMGRQAFLDLVGTGKVAAA